MTKRHREEPVIRPFRLVESRLAVPGVIGMREARHLSFGKMQHVLFGPDAGFPEAHPLAERKSDVALVDAREVSPELRKQADIRLPEEERAEFEVYLWEMAEQNAEFMPDTRELKALALDQLSRLTALDAQTRHFLESHGQAYWLAGYTRHSDTRWVHRVGGAAPSQSWVQWRDAVREDGRGRGRSAPRLDWAGLLRRRVSAGDEWLLLRPGVRLMGYPSASLISPSAPARYAPWGSCPSYAPQAQSLRSPHGLVTSEFQTRAQPWAWKKRIPAREGCPEMNSGQDCWLRGSGGGLPGPRWAARAGAHHQS